MKTTNRSAALALLAAGAVSTPGQRAFAWDPPDGTASDQANQPATPTTPLNRAHGYITQNGIAILNNDGYWFAAQMLWNLEPELINGARYADEKDGRQGLYIQQCALFGLDCSNLAGPNIWPTYSDWPEAADNHYYNPDTELGLDAQEFYQLISNARIPTEILEVVDLDLYSVGYTTEPTMLPQYLSSVAFFQATYKDAVNAYLNNSAPSINGRTGTALAMFYLGWSSHLMQDATQVYHTFDQPSNGHAQYEAAADGLYTAPPPPTGQQTGIYAEQLPYQTLTNSPCVPPNDRACFVVYAANTSHDTARYNAVQSGDYSSIPTAIAFAQNLQAGLYKAFLTDIGQAPVHMSALMPSINNF